MGQSEFVKGLKAADKNFQGMHHKNIHFHKNYSKIPSSVQNINSPVQKYNMDNFDEFNWNDESKALWFTSIWYWNRLCLIIW